LANNPSWAKQIEEFDTPTLSYVFPKIEESNNTNEVKVLESVLKPYGVNVNNISTRVRTIYYSLLHKLICISTTVE